MPIDPKTTTTITEATARSLATTGPHGVNVVPISVVDIEDDCIYLYNFFMGKTVENLTTEPAVALTCWTGLSGIQVKAVATYITEGKQFEAAVATMKELFPDRTLSGLIKLTPTTVYDISAGETAGTLIAEGA